MRYLPIKGHDKCNICTVEFDRAIENWNGQKEDGNEKNCKQFPIEEQLFRHQKHFGIRRFRFGILCLTCNHFNSCHINAKVHLTFS